MGKVRRQSGKRRGRGHNEWKTGGEYSEHSGEEKKRRECGENQIELQ